jgi:hypothetical protein
MLYFKCPSCKGLFKCDRTTCHNKICMCNDCFTRGFSKEFSEGWNEFTTSCNLKVCSEAEWVANTL